MRNIKNKYFIQTMDSSEYLSTSIQITAKQYWKEFENCKKYMNDHNSSLSEEDKEYYGYRYEDEFREEETFKSIDRIFYLGGSTVFLTQLTCKDGYTFTNRR